MIAALLFGLAFSATFLGWLYAVARLDLFDEWHHEWIGVALAIAPWGPPWLGVVGLLVMLDDAVQHLVQIRRPAYRSPLHLAYRYTLWRAWVWVRTRWAVWRVTQ